MRALRVSTASTVERWPLLSPDGEGEDDRLSPTDDADPQVNVDAVAPIDPLIERSEGEPPPPPPTKVQDLLKKHQAKRPDDQSKA